jgi:hypothetical protein
MLCVVLLSVSESCIKKDREKVKEPTKTPVDTSKDGDSKPAPAPDLSRCGSGVDVNDVGSESYSREIKDQIEEIDAIIAESYSFKNENQFIGFTYLASGTRQTSQAGSVKEPICAKVKLDSKGAEMVDSEVIAFLRSYVSALVQNDRTAAPILKTLKNNQPLSSPMRTDFCLASRCGFDVAGDGYKSFNYVNSADIKRSLAEASLRLHGDTLLRIRGYYKEKLNREISQQEVHGMLHAAKDAAGLKVEPLK